jgi:hypothetical protein
MSNKLMPIRILIPGKSYTQGFMQSMLRLTSALGQGDLPHSIHNYYGPYLPEVRNTLLRGGTSGNVGPLGGYYAYIMWIETDIVFTPDDFYKLYSSALQNNLDFVTGLFPMGPQRPSRAVAGTWKEGRLPMNATGIEEIDYCGVGFLLVKKGVYESLSYPWYGMGDIYTFNEYDNTWSYNGDDFSTAKRLQEKGWKLYANCDVKLGHEKPYIVRGNET